MKYTKEQLECMHNDELSKLLCASLGFNVQNFVFEGAVTIEQVGKVSTFDMMDWNDIMPLAVEHKISLLEGDELWGAYQNFGIYEDINYRISHGHFCGDKSPQRAIACCLILVLQEK